MYDGIILLINEGYADGYSLGTEEGLIGEILEKKDGTADGMVDGFTLDDGRDVGRMVGFKDGCAD